MTGQIPPYGKNFKHDRVGSYHPVLNDAIYVFRRDEMWFIRADKGSKRWYVFHGMNRNQATCVSKVQPNMRSAMELMIDGADQGFYQLRENGWRCEHERQAASAGTWRTDQDWTSHCASTS